MFPYCVGLGLRYMISSIELKGTDEPWPCDRRLSRATVGE